MRQINKHQTVELYIVRYYSALQSIQVHYNCMLLSVKKDERDIMGSKLIIVCEAKHV